MAANSYPKAVSTAGAEAQSSTRTATIVFVVAIALLNVIGWPTDWSRWAFFVPAVSISVAIFIRHWLKQRRQTQVCDGVQAQD